MHYVLTIENEKVSLGFERKSAFIFNVRVNPYNTEGTDSIRHFFSIILVLRTIPG